jgi:hypothetical protein
VIVWPHRKKPAGSLPWATAPPASCPPQHEGGQPRRDAAREEELRRDGKSGGGSLAPPAKKGSDPRDNRGEANMNKLDNLAAETTGRLFVTEIMIFRMLRMLAERSGDAAAFMRDFVTAVDADIFAFSTDETPIGAEATEVARTTWGTYSGHIIAEISDEGLA